MTRDGHFRQISTMRRKISQIEPRSNDVVRRFGKNPGFGLGFLRHAPHFLFKGPTM